MVIDYFSHYAEIAKMNSTTSACTIATLTNIFTRHSIPEIVRSDNGPQYCSYEFAAFAKSSRCAKKQNDPVPDWHYYCASLKGEMWRTWTDS